MPGPLPAARPQFTPDDVTVLQALVRRPSLPHRTIQRAKLALLLHAEPDLPSPVAAARLGQHPNGVRHWRQRWARDGFSLAALADRPRSGRPPTFTPLVEATVTAVACELPAQREQPLSRYSLADIQHVVQAEGLVPRISRSTVCRYLRRRARKPWRFRSWIFVRDPDFAAKAARVLDLYAGYWAGQPLGPDDYVLSADEKTSIQARLRCHPSCPARSHQPQLVEFEYERMGAVQYLAAWDVRRGLVFGRCEAQTGIEPFGHLVQQVMEQEPYRSANRVFWLVDNGSSHRGKAAVQRLAAAYPNLILVHLPVHASWLNQIEIDFSIVQRKVLTPNDFADCAAVAARLLAFQERRNAHPTPFDWRFTREDLERRLREQDPDLAADPAA